MWPGRLQWVPRVDAEQIHSSISERFRKGRHAVAKLEYLNCFCQWVLLVACGVNSGPTMTRKRGKYRGSDFRNRSHGIKYCTKLGRCSCRNFITAADVESSWH